MKHANVALFVPDAGCKHRCIYCNQRTISGETKRISTRDVEDAACTAIQSGVQGKNAEIAFFGGSFTAIERSYMLELLDAARPFIENGFFHGIRISTRPDAINKETLSLLKAYHVTAIELGCQSMDDRVLRLCARGHTAAQVEEACRLVQAYGFELGVQMMTGLPGDTDEGCIETAKKLIALHPVTVRIYPTLVLEGTPLAALWRSGAYRTQTLDEAVNLCSRLLELFQNAGVRVIRLGLHSGGGVEEGFLAGPNHPAFREKCEATIYRNRLEKLLKKQSKGSYTVLVGERFLSQAAGQRKENLLHFDAMGYQITFKPDALLQQYEIEIQGNSLCF